MIARELFQRLPPSFTAYFAQRISEWEQMFPAERTYVERLFEHLEAAPLDAVEQFFAPLRAIEAKMGIDRKKWDGRRFTLEHVDFLNRSPHYAEWRAEIQRIFGVLDPAIEAVAAEERRPNVVIVLAPPELPMGPERMWTRLAGEGRRIRIENASQSEFLPLLLTGRPAAANAASLADNYRELPHAAPYGSWFISAGEKLAPYAVSDTVHISFDGLSNYRDRLMAKVQETLEREQAPGPRELAAILSKLRLPSGVPRLDGSPQLVEYVRSVFLSGNGTLLINNTFVEWATAQAARRARPQLAVVSFGIRNKLKPFSNLLMFRDQDRANIVPSQADVLGSYVDLEVFYHYVWLAFEKYPEYRGKTVYFFCGEHLEEALLIAPDPFVELFSRPAVSLPDFHGACREWLAA